MTGDLSIISNIYDIIDKGVSFISNISTILASGLAIYIYFTQKSKISKFITSIINFSNQISLRELLTKVSKLEENASSNRKVIQVMIGGITGQIRGNSELMDKLSKIVRELEGYLEDPKQITQVSITKSCNELKENLKSLEIGFLTSNQK